jgi:hypothetical protein
MASVAVARKVVFRYIPYSSYIVGHDVIVAIVGNSAIWFSFTRQMTTLNVTNEVNPIFVPTKRSSSHLSQLKKYVERYYYLFYFILRSVSF